MNYRAEYDAKTKKLRIFVDDLPANQYEFARIQQEQKPWLARVYARHDDGTISREVHPRMLSLADLRKELDALDATRYKELSFIATAN